MKKYLGTKQLYVLSFIMLFTVLLLLSLDKHERTGRFNYHSEIYADKSGYYMYLPAQFIYNWQGNEMPENIVEKVGYGFTIDTTNNKIITKYTSGVSILVSPFFLMAHGISKLQHNNADGFLPIYHKFMNVAAAFYCALGLLITFVFLSFYFNWLVSSLATVVIFAGTNLYYYTIDDTLMAHVYGFFLVAVFAYTSKRIIENSNTDWLLKTTWAFVFALAILIRPTNVLMFVIFLLLDFVSFKESWYRVKDKLLNLKTVLLIVSILFIIFLPQLLYWKYAFGKYFAYSYKGEGFTNWNNPQLFKVWFSTSNGLFPYNPLYLIVLIGCFWLLYIDFKKGLLPLFIFSILSYSCASWHIWNFGCSFGQRSFVDYATVFAFPIAFLINEISRLKLKWLYSIGIFTILFAYINVRLTYAYDKCFFGGVWDWKVYLTYYDETKMFGITSNRYTYVNNFDKAKMPAFTLNQGKRSSKYALSDEYSAVVDSTFKNSIGFTGKAWKIGCRPLRNVEVNFTSFCEKGKSKGFLVCTIDSSGITLPYFAVPLDSIADSNIIEKSDSQEWVSYSYIIPFHKEINRSFVVNVYVQSNQKEPFYIDDFKAVFRY